MLTSSGSAVGTCFMHHVAFASRLEPEVHRDRDSFGAAVASSMGKLFFLKCLQVTGPFLTQSFSLVWCSFPKHWPMLGKL